MKTKINIVLGFIGSGKTSFINSMLKTDELANEKIVIIQNEFGETDINDTIYNSNKLMNIINLKNDSNEDITDMYIRNILLKYSPDRIFIEENSMKNPNSIINIFNDKSVKKLCIIDDIVAIINAKQFFILLKNLKNIISNQIFNSDSIVLNSINELDKNEFKSIQKEIKKINETASLIEYVPNLNIKEIFQEEFREIRNRSDFSIMKNLFYMGGLVLLFTCLVSLYMSDSISYNGYLVKFQKLYIVFLSILIQGLPFILVGSFVSAIIQIYISKETFIKIFPKNIFLSCISAAFAGLLFPICDCGTIPVVKGFMKKKIPIGAGITFMLAAPIVNPIAIISTMYAFQGMKSVVIYRVCSGIIIAIVVGLIMQLSIKKEDEILKDNTNLTSCNCGLCDNEDNTSENKFEKIRSVFIHAGEEFFNTGKYMIIGTILSTIFQNVISLNNKGNLPNDNRLSLIFMILIAFLLSICSTSDAFVAKGFLTQFSINSVMGFLVVGPMLDIKNAIMLFGNFKNKFVLKLMFFVFLVSYCVLINIGLIYLSY
ncbi:permease [Clostridium saccharoperbutylacetonicum]